MAAKDTHDIHKMKDAMHNMSVMKFICGLLQPFRIKSNGMEWQNTSNTIQLNFEWNSFGHA